MKACIIKGKNQIQLEERPVPVPGRGGVLVRVSACGICSSDLNRVFNGSAYHYPIILGHEFSGEVVEVGASVPHELVGKTVVVYPLLPCKECNACRCEDYTHCLNYNYIGSRCDGAMCEYVAVPVWNCVPYDHSLDSGVAAMCEPSAVAYHAIEQIEIRSGVTLCIVGTGTIGILAGMWARKKGARVIFVGRNTSKKQFLAERLGFKEYIVEVESVGDLVREMTYGEGADAAVECVGNERSLANAILVLRRHGTLVQVGNPNGDMRLTQKTYWEILRSELTLKGVWNSSYNMHNNEWHHVIRELERNSQCISQLITQRFRIEECTRAFYTLREEHIFSIKGMFCF